MKYIAGPEETAPVSPSLIEAAPDLLALMKFLVYADQSEAYLIKRPLIVEAAKHLIARAEKSAP